jgi:hypothetical protein
VRVPITLYLVALAARALTGWLFPDPAYPDATYYVGVARALAAGHGFNIDFIWNFVDVGGRLPAAATLPIPSNAHWMPLASLIQAPFIAVLGTAPIVALIPFMLVGATTAPLTWAIALEARLTRDQALAAGLMAAVPGAVTPFLGQPDNFALFMPLGALALWLCARALGGDPRAFILGGLIVGLATLARNDGILLGIPFALGWLALRWRALRLRPGAAAGAGARSGSIGSSSIRSPSIRSAIGFVVGFVTVMGPWYLRQLSVFGSLSPSATSGRILWIADYNQLFSITGEPTISSFLAQGLGSIAQSRLAGFLTAFEILAALPFLLFLVPFVLWAAWTRRRSVHFGPWIVYGITLLLFSGLLFAVHVPYGTFLHSAVAAVPHAYVLGVEGIGLAVAWVAQRRRHWEVPRATRNFTAIAVAMLWLGGAAATLKAHDGWEADAEVRRAASAELVRVARPGDRLMSADPGAYRYYAALGGIVTPADPIDVAEQAMRAYDVAWLVLERAHIVDAFAPLYLGAKPLPTWMAEVSQDPGGGLPRFRIYAICLAPDDPRPACAAGRP